MQNLSSEDFYKPCKWNSQTKTQVWMSEIADAHDNFCGCHTPFAHLLASIFPPGHRDRPLSIEQILNRDYQECHSGGDAEENLGLAAGAADAPHTEEEEGDHFIKDEELERLIAAGEDATGR